MSDEILQMAIQLVNRQKTRVPAMSVRDLNNLMMCIRFFTASPESTERLARIAQRLALYRCKRALSA